MVLGMGLSIAGAGMRLLETPLPFLVVSTVEASAPNVSAGIPDTPSASAVTESQPLGPALGSAPASALESADGSSQPVDVPVIVAQAAYVPSAPMPDTEPEPAPLVEVAQATAPRARRPVASLPSAANVAVAGVYSTEKAIQLVAYMNAARIEANLPPMSTDALLATVAGVRAEDLAEREYFDHYSPDGSSAFSELSARGIRYGLAGENLARNNFPDAESLKVAFDALMASEGHRANILEPRFTRVGVAAILDGQLWIYVMVFMD